MKWAPSEEGLGTRRVLTGGCQVAKMAPVDQEWADSEGLRMTKRAPGGQEGNDCEKSAR